MINVSKTKYCSDRCYLVSEILAMEHSAEEAIEKIRASVTEDD